jgi:hypothetical protein
VPAFAQERAQGLAYRQIPACVDDRRLDFLSRLDRKQCARKTVQYLKGTHPDFRPRDTLVQTRSPTDRLAAASTLEITEETGRASIRNVGAPERLAPEEKADRLNTLAMQVDALLEEAEQSQVPPSLKTRLARYGQALRVETPTYIRLDGPMSVLKGAVTDPYVTAGLDQGFLAGWRHLIEAHDALRDLLIPRTEEPPAPTLGVTPEDGTALVDDALDAAQAAAGGAFDETLVDTLDSIRDYFDAAKSREEERPALIRKGLGALGGLTVKIVVALGAGSSVVTLTQWVATPQGQAFLLQMRAIFDRILAYYPG